MISGTAWLEGSAAWRSGMMAQRCVPTLASASGTSGKGFFSRRRMVRSSAASTSSVAAISA